MSTNSITTRRNAVGSFLDRIRDRWATAPGWQRWTVYVLLFIGALLLPSESIGSFMSPYADWPSVLFFPIGTYVLLAIGLNVVVGQAGLLDLGYVAFFAIGGYSMAMLGTKVGLNFWEIMVVGVVLSAISGIVLGGPTLRLRGDYLAIVTLGFGEIVRQTAENTDAIGGPRGIAGIPHPPSFEAIEIFGVQPFKYGVLDPRPYYYLLVVLATLIIIFVKRWEKSRVGRAWAAIREDEDAAEVMGVPTFKFKLLAFAIGASIGGAMGVMWAGKTISINPNDFLFMLSATILAAVVLGGSGNIPGVMLGAFLVAWLPERFRGLSDYRILVFGAAIVALMIFRPEGLLPSRRRKAELAEGTGGMGSMGAEVPGPETQAAAEGAAK
ncbi:branched-chain amino acid ABC transporter permease [Sphaerisporangium siamense]|uniref:Branched-chain amino acid transport system permease protein n=1 Tax=Sphaerisporangium siamense TaxID=795645 RepID=A0A7W7DDB2_9ACTN|nr:branched-chain amino acid ABC transporter permease [Sphaerisporangium siamense]MBB4704698.1 branched-chain amino acid transport system permease protein [Sphaerisporangium siamense]GII86313.1 branched-chain amino acid ABC transporter permease [Sphaerisporangium siamense]